MYGRRSSLSLVTQRNAHTSAYIKPIGGRQLTSMDESEFGIPSTETKTEEKEIFPNRRDKNVETKLND